MAKIVLTNKQLKLIQDSLELYTRVGILQFREIFNHPSVNNFMQKSVSDDIKNCKDVNWKKFHKNRDKIEKLFGDINRIILEDDSYTDGASPGIFNENSVEALEAFDLIKVIRHEFWKENPISFGHNSRLNLHTSQPAIKVELDSAKESLNNKINKIRKNSL